MKKKIFVLLFTIMFGWCSTLMMPASTVSAADGGCEHMLFGIFKPWYAGLPMGDNCSLQLDSTGEDGSGLASFVWQIVLNVLFDLMAAASIVAVGFVIYGGYLFITSEGDPGKAAKAKKTISSAIIGLIITLLATAIINTITGILS
ncbi:hypothetical protein IJK16_03425 [Candidatus Saccharibacteria bacterium]|nr:hypothetical protein [Candidatus Saccharibacteria bacterium]